jgi:hypothetical protein
MFDFQKPKQELKHLFLRRRRRRNEIKTKFLFVKQLLSLYFRFYKVIMLESTNATDEGKMRVYF